MATDLDATLTSKGGVMEECYDILFQLRFF